MKKFVVLLLTAGLVVAGCGASSGTSASATSINSAAEVTDIADAAASTEVSTGDLTGEGTTDTESDTAGSLNPTSITADEDTLKSVSDAQEEDLVKRLTAQSEELISRIDSYDGYIQNVDQVEAFYDTVLQETDKTLILLRQDSAAYAEALISTGEDAADIYDDLDDILDDVYNGAVDDVRDDIYDGLLDDMNDAFYDGVLDDSDAADDYSDWMDTYSGEYKMRTDCASDVYKACSEAGSDIYKFVSEMRSDAYKDDLDAVREDIDDFNSDIDTFVRKSNGDASGTAETSDAASSGSLDPISITADDRTLKSVADAQEEDLVNRLTAQSEELIGKIDSYEAYVKSADQVEDFYNTVVSETNKTLILFRQDCSAYASALLDSGEDADEIYDDLDSINDDVYSGALEDVYSDIYDGLLDDMYDAFYDGVLSDSDDAEDYSSWSDTIFDEYDRYSDCCSDVYDAYSDAGSDIYGFYIDLGSDVFGDDLEDARDDIDDYNADLDKLIGKTDGAAESSSEASTGKDATSAEAEKTAKDEGAKKDSGEDASSDTSIRMQTSIKYSSVIPKTEDYFSKDPTQSVESDAGLFYNYSYCDMDEVNAYVDALKDAGFTVNAAEIDSGEIYQYAATDADDFYVVLTCQYKKSSSVDPYMNFSVTEQ